MLEELLHNLYEAVEGCLSVDLIELPPAANDMTRIMNIHVRERSLYSTTVMLSRSFWPFVMLNRSEASPSIRYRRGWEMLHCGSA